MRSFVCNWWWSTASIFGIHQVALLSAGSSAGLVEALADARQADSVSQSFHGHGTLDLMKRALDTIDAFERLHVNGSDIKARLEVMVQDASLLREGYADLQARGQLPWQHVETKRLPAIGFVSTRETGASSVVNILQRLGESRGWKFALPENDFSLGQLQSVQSRHTSDILCNHAVYDDALFRSHLRVAPFIFSMVRQPVHHVQNLFEDKLDSAEQFLGYDVNLNWADRIAWLNLLWRDRRVTSTDDRAKFMNPQARDLGWYNYVGGSTEFDQDDEKIDEWTGSLLKNMSSVVLTEYLDEGLLLLRRKLGLELSDVRYLLNNGTRINGFHAPDQDERLAINSLLKVDFRLYQRANETFWQAWEDEGGYSFFGPELQELGLLNNVLAKACNRQREKICRREFQASNADYTKHLKARVLQMNKQQI